MDTSISPPIGMALWLLKGKRLPDRIDWLLQNGFTGVALLQSVMDVDGYERDEAAALIKESGVFLTYHGNVHHRLTGDNRLDLGFVARVMDDVLWWHENTNGVSCCCSDPIHATTPDGEKRFLWERAAELVRLMAGKFSPKGIRVGIENSFGGEGRFCSVADFSRFVDECNVPNLGMLLDAAHANIHTRSDQVEGERGLSEYVENIPMDILEVHLSDNLGERDEHRHLGYGRLDLKALFGALKNRGFTGHLTLEVCLDILAGEYGADIENPKETDPILISRDAIREAWIV